MYLIRLLQSSINDFIMKLNFKPPCLANGNVGKKQTNNKATLNRKDKESITIWVLNKLCEYLENWLISQLNVCDRKASFSALVSEAGLQTNVEVKKVKWERAANSTC